MKPVPNTEVENLKLFVLSRSNLTYYKSGARQVSGYFTGILKKEGYMKKEQVLI